MNEPRLVLVAEDNATQADLLRMVLESGGYAPLLAENGAEALDLLAERTPCLILSDIVMPVMDGFDLCRRVKDDPELKGIPVVLLTMLSDPKDVIRGLQCGADHFVTKPYHPQRLLAQLDGILRNREARRRAVPGWTGEVFFAGESFHITAEREQVVDLLLSTYDNAVLKNAELVRAHASLQALHREVSVKNARLLELDQQKNKLLGMAAHDLRSPLSAILAFSNLLNLECAKALPAEHQQMLRHIEESSEFMLQLINDLLDVAAIEAGRVELRPRRCDAMALVQKSIGINRPLASRKRIELHVVADTPLVEIELDPDRFLQVLNNLVSNALKFSEPGTAVSVSLGQDAEWLRVAVQDQGPGIPPAERGKLFAPFSKTSVRSTAGEASTGLGLSITRQLVSAQGGLIGVLSEVGKGSTFYFSLPCARPAPVD